MSQTTPYPQWLQTTELKDWPVTPVESSELHYRLAIRQGWQTQPQVNHTGVEIEHCFTGRSPGERLTIAVLPTVNPQDDICNWVNGQYSGQKSAP